MRQTGVAYLPLHGGKAPAWLFQRMVRLGREIARLIVEDHGPEELLIRLSDPYWFQSFGCVLGFDWHSSGVTTTVCGALKDGHPYPVNREVYDKSIEILKRSLERARVERSEKENALKRLLGIFPRA